MCFCRLEGIVGRTRLTWIAIAFGVLRAFVATCLRGEDRGFDPSGSDAAAIAVADRTMAAMGGIEAWESVAYLAFNFVAGNRAYYHAWDRVRGLYRASWVEPPQVESHPYTDLVGKRIDTVFELATLEATTVADGARVENHAKVAYLIIRRPPRGGYSRFVNDAYWRLMPYKLKDPGVRTFSSRDRKPGRTGRCGT